MKKVLILTYYWPPSGGAGVQRWLKLARYLSEKGVSVHILTVDPEYALYPQRDERLLEEVNGLQVYRTRAFSFGLARKKNRIPFGGFVTDGRPGFRDRLVKWVRGNCIFPDPRVGWNHYAFKKAMEVIRKEVITTVITSSPPHSTQLIGLKLKKRMGSRFRWIADMRDPWTDIYYFDQLGIGKRMAKKHRRYEEKVLREADEVMTVGPYLKKMLVHNGGISPEKVRVLPNGYDEADFRLLPDLDAPVADLCYTGTMGEQYRIETLVAVLKELQKHLRCRFIGSVHPRWRELLEKELGDRVMFEWIPYLPHDQALAYLQHARMLLLVIPEVKHNECILTGKLFEYLRAGRPVLCLGPPNGDAAAVLKETGAGETFDYDDRAGIRSFLSRDTDGMNYGGMSERIALYSRENEAAMLAGWIQDDSGQAAN